MSKIDERIEKAAKEYAEQESKIFSHKTAMDITFIQSKAGFIAGVEWALSHQWRSVENEMPEPNNDVIVTYTDHLTGNECVGIANYDKIDGKWYSADAEIYINRHSIKYWMPIPPQPKDRKEGGGMRCLLLFLCTLGITMLVIFVSVVVAFCIGVSFESVHRHVLSFAFCVLSAIVAGQLIDKKKGGRK